MLLVITILKNLLVLNIYAEIIIISALAGIVYLGLIFLAKIIDLKGLRSLLMHVMK
jgi:hypothetical protein